MTAREMIQRNVSAIENHESVAMGSLLYLRIMKAWLELDSSLEKIGEECDRGEHTDIAREAREKSAAIILGED